MCLICDRIEMIKNGTNPYFVKELETGYVVIGDNQHFYGYSLFLYKNHDYTELFQLDMEERTKFLQEMSIVAEATSKAFAPEKMNYELLGMGDAHLHWHRQPWRQRGRETHIFTGIFIPDAKGISAITDITVWVLCGACLFLRSMPMRTVLQKKSLI